MEYMNFYLIMHLLQFQDLLMIYLYVLILLNIICYNYYLDHIYLNLLNHKMLDGQSKKNFVKILYFTFIYPFSSWFLLCKFTMNIT